MPLRSLRFYLSAYLHYYGHIRLPLLLSPVAVLGSPTFMRYLLCTRYDILPRKVHIVRVVVASDMMAGFTFLDRLTTFYLRNEA